MSRRPFDPRELGQPSADADRATTELESYLADTATGAPHGFAQRVMAAVEKEAAPGRGFLAWLLAPSGSTGGLRRVVRASVLAATLVIAVAGAIFAGQLTGLIRSVGNGSPSEVESVSPTSSQSETLSPTTSPGETSAESAGASAESPGSPGASETVEPSDNETPEASADGSVDESKTPRTASPSPTPTAHP